MTKSSRFQYRYRDSASKFHQQVGEVLRNSRVFQGYEIYQEYPLDKVDPNCRYSKFHFDWVIPKLKLIIEVHGQQHYEPVRFGGISQEDAESNLCDQKYRDSLKKDTAIKVGWTYIAIPYYDSITEERILELYDMASKQTPVLSTTRREGNSSRKERAREYRHEQYLRSKARQASSRSRT